MENKFYYKTWFVILMLVLIAPVGIILLWTGKKYNTALRTVLSIVFGIFFIGIIAGSLNQGDSVTTNNSTNDAAQSKDTQDNSYMTEGDWALFDSNYLFAVEINDYGGDIYQAGSYKFELTGADEKNAGVFDIYTSNKLVTNSSELTDDMLKGSVGGINLDTLSLNLSKGTYVYIVPYKDLAYEPHGILKVKKVN